MIAIVYCSGAGHTARLAELIAEGANAEGMDTVLVDAAAIDADDWARLDASEAIVFGAPTYMGSASATFKTFMDETSDRWSDQVWADKLAAGFTVATYASGDKLVTLQQLATLAAQHGMLWIGQKEIGPRGSDPEGVNWQGSWLGLMAVSSRKGDLVTPGDSKTAHLFGRRIAAATRRWGTGG